MIRWTGLAPWKFEFPFPGSLTSTFLSPPYTLHPKPPLHSTPPLPPRCERTCVLDSLGVVERGADGDAIGVDDQEPAEPGVRRQLLHCLVDLRLPCLELGVQGWKVQGSRGNAIGVEGVGVGVPGWGFGAATSPPTPSAALPPGGGGGGEHGFVGPGGEEGGVGLGGLGG